MKPYFCQNEKFNKKTFFKALSEHYWPKNEHGDFIKYVGDIESNLPATFLNEVMPEYPFSTWGNKDSHGYFFNKKSHYGTTPSAYGSLFIDQNYGTGNLKPNGVFKSMYFDFEKDLVAEAKTEADKKSH